MHRLAAAALLVVLAALLWGEPNRRGALAEVVDLWERGHLELAQARWDAAAPRLSDPGFDVSGVTLPRRVPTPRRLDDASGLAPRHAERAARLRDWLYRHVKDTHAREVLFAMLVAPDPP